MHSSKRLVLAGAVLAAVATAGLIHGLARHAIAAPVAANATAAGPINLEQSDPQALDTGQQTELARHLAAWEALPLAQRQQRRAHYLAWWQLEESERAALRDIAAEFSGFDAARQAALREEFAALDETQQRGWQLGPVLGADYTRLHPLLAYVPANQRQPLLKALRGLDAQQRADLAVLAQRTAPQERNELRNEFLQTAAAARAAWLQQQLGN